MVSLDHIRLRFEMSHARGEGVVHWVANILNLALGGNFLQQAIAAPAPHRIFFLDLWPFNDVPQIYTNLFQLAAQIELVGSSLG